MPRLTTLVLGLITAVLSGSLFPADTEPTIQFFNKMPLSFTKNMGQWDERVLFRANAGGATMWFTKEGVTYQFTRHVDGGNRDNGRGTLHVPAGTRSVPLLGTPQLAAGDDHFGETRDSIEQLVLTAKFLGANPNPEVIAEDQMEYKCNYFLGNDPSGWHTDVPNYEAITLKEIYPGIDLKYSGDGSGQAVYEFIAAPGADMAQIKVEYEGAEVTSLDADGRLILKTKWGDMIAGLKSPTSGVLSGSCAWWMSSSTMSPQDLAHGDVRQARASMATLAVELVYSTYLGGAGDEEGNDIAVDDGGNVYVVGYTSSSNFPTLNPYQPDQGSKDVFVIKLSASGNSLIYGTYLGGGSDDYGKGITVDDSGYAYVTGAANSSNFPTLNPYQTYQGPTNYSDVFVTKLSSSGNSLIYSTYIGGSHNDYGRHIAADAGGYAYVMGYTWSSDFPTLNPYQTYQGGWDVFVTKLSAAGSSLIYSTYLGGGGDDKATGIAVDGSGNAYVTGSTSSSNFPTLNPYQTNPDTTKDVFVTKFSSAGNSLIYSTYLGGVGYEEGYSIAVDSSGIAYVTGKTSSTDFPTLNPFQATFQGGTSPYVGDIFVTGVSNAGNELIYSTYLGGTGDEMGWGIAVNGGGNAYVTGEIWSPNFPTLNPFQATLQGSEDAFVTKLYFDVADDVSDELAPVSLPERPTLDQNYPNPFNPSTEIGFDLPKPSFVFLDIYDVLGRKVSTLIDEHLAAGRKRVQWDGSDNTGAEAASGVYFYRLRIGDHVEVKKMVLLK